MKRSSRTGRKVLISAAVLGAAAAVAGLGTFGTFTSTTSASATASSGTVVIGLGNAGTADNRLTVASGLMVPGDTMQRQVKLNNTGNQALSQITLTTTATTTSLLDTDATNGLQLTVQSCPTAWTEAGTSPGYTYTCTGATTVIASRPVVGSNVVLTGTSALTNGNSDNLLVKLSFPTSADNTFQNKSSVISFSFTGTQRAATDR
jgi:spore coat-associated protein N